MLTNWDCPHHPPCRHHEDQEGNCMVDFTTVGRRDRTVKIRVLATGGWRCPRCTCARTAGILSHLDGCLERRRWVWWTDDADPDLLPNFRHQARRQSVDLVTVRRYGAGTILLADGQITGYTIPRLERTARVVAVGRLSRALRCSARPWGTTFAKVRGVEREVGAGQVARVDWSTGWRPPAQPRRPPEEVSAGVARAGSGRHLIESNTPYSVDAPLPADAVIEDAVVEIQEALSGQSYVTGWPSVKHAPNVSRSPDPAP